MILFWLNGTIELYRLFHKMRKLFNHHSYTQGRLVIGCDEKTGMQVLERKTPTKPAQPGRRERREHEYIRHGTRVLINSLAVATGHIAWTIGTTRKATDFVAHLQRAYQHLPRMAHYDWVMDN